MTLVAIVASDATKVPSIEKRADMILQGQLTVGQGPSPTCGGQIR